MSDIVFFEEPIRHVRTYIETFLQSIRTKTNVHCTYCTYNLAPSSYPPKITLLQKKPSDVAKVGKLCWIYVSRALGTVQHIHWTFMYTLSMTSLCQWFIIL